MFLPSGEVLLIKKDGTSESIEIVDIQDVGELKEDIEDAFKRGFKREDYTEARYMEDGAVIFTILL